MTKICKHFELDQKDISHIELALTQRVGDLTRKVMETSEQATQAQPSQVPDSPGRQQYLQEIESIRSLLGRLHGQKIWYEPKDYVPRG